MNLSEDLLPAFGAFTVATDTLWLVPKKVLEVPYLKVVLKFGHNLNDRF